MSVAKLATKLLPFASNRSATSVTLVSVRSPVLVTMPLKVSTAPGATAPGGQVFATTMAGWAQIPQPSKNEFVTTAFGPPIVVVSRAVAVTKHLARPAQAS